MDLLETCLNTRVSELETTLFQGDSADLVSLRDMCLGADDVTTTAVGNPLIGDVETEQLLSEIELLTSRTLHETNQARI